MHFSRVDGHLLPNFVGKPVVILGTIGKKSSDGRGIELKTTDGVQVNVTLPEPLDGNLDGYVEVMGTLQSKSTLSSTKYHIFPPEVAADFDIEQYSEMIKLYNLFGPKIWEACNVED